jgi:hypothetical protein
MPDDLILVDTPAEHIRRITLNRPEKRNSFFCLRLCLRLRLGPPA